MQESTHVLNRTVVFTEIPGAPRLPVGTRLVVRTNSPVEHYVTAVTPAGQRYEFKSMHIGGLIKTPWVSPVAPDGAIKVGPDVTTKPTTSLAAQIAASAKEVNPFTIGDVASVEDGIGNDVMPQLDVTGSSAHEDFNKSEIKPDREFEVTETVVDMGPTEEEVTEIDDTEETEEVDVTTPKAKGRKKAK